MFLIFTFKLSSRVLILMIERFSLECRKAIGFHYNAKCSAEKTSANFSSNQNKVKPKPIFTRWHAFSRALRQLHVITIKWLPKGLQWHAS